MGLAALFTSHCGQARSVQPPLESGEVAVVIYNSRVPASREVAEHYAARRGVPPGQVKGFALPVGEVMSRAEFRAQLQEPLFQWLVSKRLFSLSSRTRDPASAKTFARVVKSRIRYAVLCYGVPLKIQNDDSLFEEDMIQVRPQLRRNEAAVDSELVWLPLLKQKPMLAGFITNVFYGTGVGSLLCPTNGVLLVGRLDGPSADIARGLVDKATQAERDGLWGRAYIDTRGIKDGNYKIGDEVMHAAARVCSTKGYDVAVDLSPATLPTEYPLSQVAIYAGWYSEHACGPFARPTIEFMPGAFAYHLHSFSAATVRSTNAHWVGPLLAGGATVTLGSVSEPYLSGTSDVAVLLRNLLLLGFSFGEAAWSAEYGFSWQTTVVGDPLYRPFHQTIEDFQRELEARHDTLAEWSYAMLADREIAHGKPLVEAVNELRQLPLLEKSAVLTEKISDLLRLEGRMIEAVSAGEQALQRNPSAQQKVRIFRSLTGLQIAAGHREAAIATLQRFLSECPDYPARADVQRELSDLARKNGDHQLKKPEATETRGSAPATNSRPTEPSR